MLDIVVNSNAYVWTEVKNVLVTSYLDKRDCFTLNLEMAELKQECNESPFKFYEKIQKLLNLQVSFFINKEPKEQIAKDVLCEYVQKLALRVLLRGFQEPLGSLMRTKNPGTLNEALNMLTNDFQFKNNKLFQNSKQNNLPRVQQYLPIRRPFTNNQPFQNYKPIYQNNPNQFNKLNYTNPNQQQRPFGNNSTQKTNQTFQPVPMSISTRQTGNTVRQNKLYQMTGKPVDEESYDHSINQLSEQITNTYLSEQAETDYDQEENFDECNNIDNSIQEDNACGFTPENEHAQNHFLGLTTLGKHFT